MSVLLQNLFSPYSPGNLRNDGTFEYAYDGWGSVVEVDDESGNFVKSYAYDGLGRRIGADYLDGGNIVETTFFYGLHGEVLEDGGGTFFDGSMISLHVIRYVWLGCGSSN